MASPQTTSFLLAAPFLTGCSAGNSEGRCWPSALSASKAAALLKLNLLKATFADSGFPQNNQLAKAVLSCLVGCAVQVLLRIFVPARQLILRITPAHSSPSNVLVLRQAINHGQAS